MKASKKRFLGWNPQVGELAVVPGGPGNACYTDTLTADDVRSINLGHRGYSPLKFYMVGYRETKERPDYSHMPGFVHFERSRNDAWWNTTQGISKSIDYVARVTRQYHGGNVVIVLTPDRELVSRLESIMESGGRAAFDAEVKRLQGV